jgi:hypothetical protein
MSESFKAPDNQTPEPENTPDLSAPRSGRPFVFTDPNDLRMRIQNYFDNCDPHIVSKQLESGYNDRGETIWKHRETMTEQIPYTITGLARDLKVSRATLVNYKDPTHYTDEISPEVRQELIDAIEDAYQRVEEYNERALHRNGVAAGIKFNLTNNFGWVDKSVVDSNVRSVESELDELDDQVDDRDKVADEAAAALAAEDAPKETEASDDKQPGSPTPE